MKYCTNYKCESCANGVVIRHVKDIKGNVEIRVAPCNSCKRPYGIKTIEKLRLVQ